ncbi:hypothetical protein BDY19DRAFT_903592 [Irpex rosettiformis]|uniref:Uncharacterized protein n=1 Tax=Irpex rosettiformis TaxID=378272 RepID=A0ACB8UF06_9APHY|nr:hypothetical protein BDY19DRAFT_903592 [Irpex rosettiformis]
MAKSSLQASKASPGVVYTFVTTRPAESNVAGDRVDENVRVVPTAEGDSTMARKRKTSSSLASAVVPQDKIKKICAPVFSSIEARQEPEHQTRYDAQLDILKSIRSTIYDLHSRTIENSDRVHTIQDHLFSIDNITTETAKAITDMRNEMKEEVVGLNKRLDELAMMIRLSTLCTNYPCIPNANGEYAPGPTDVHPDYMPQAAPAMHPQHSTHTIPSAYEIYSTGPSTYPHYPSSLNGWVAWDATSTTDELAAPAIPSERCGSAPSR